jgi:hypothetical protein
VRRTGSGRSGKGLEVRARSSNDGPSYRPAVLIRAYGLFWRREEVIWNPGAGNRGYFRLLGRRGKNLPGLTVADFRGQRGIYILYGNHGPHYVGLTKKQDLGNRLRDHTFDLHGGNWDRFSWFGFREVLLSKDADGYPRLRDVPLNTVVKPDRIIGDIEALLIQAMNVRNVANMNFAKAHRWEQVRLIELDIYLTKAKLDVPDLNRVTYY